MALAALAGAVGCGSSQVHHAASTARTSSAPAASSSPAPAQPTPTEPVSTGVCQQVATAWAPYEGGSNPAPTNAQAIAFGKYVWAQAQTIPVNEVNEATSETPGLKVELDILAEDWQLAARGAPPDNTTFQQLINEVETDCYTLGVDVFGSNGG